MKKIIKHFLLLLLFTTSFFAQNNIGKLEKTTSFFPQFAELNGSDIKYYYFLVPENWNRPLGNKIKIAVAVLKSNSKSQNSNPVLFIDGGPGGSGIEGIWTWLKHPIREKSDIVLVDARGTGNSLPKFCPDLGKQFLEILAKNQNAAQDEQQKIIAAMACKQDLMTRDIDLSAYNSKAIVKDFNALKTALKYQNWNIYSVSYGTYIAQVYANDFPADIKSIILDSSISDISKDYYNNSTSKFMNSLEKVFEDCKNDPNCNKQYPNLENTFYSVIERLNKKPITVEVDKKIIPGGTFTYNVEDFKVCLQQSLYQKQLIEVIPLLIKQFKEENKPVLSSLVAAFSGALSLDYGNFYCVTCNEAFPFNSISEFDKDALPYKKLKGGLSFYKSDFQVCDKWNQNNDSYSKTINDLSNLSKVQSPVLIFSGEFDPVTPPVNGESTFAKFQNAYLIQAPISGHGSSFSEEGFKIVNEFIQNPSKKPDTKNLESNNKVNFATNVELNPGVSNFGNSLNEFNLVFFAPLFIAILVLLASIVSFCIGLFKRKEVKDKLLKALFVLTSILGLFIVVQLVLALNITAQDNFYILAFGLPNQYIYLFQLQWVFLALVLISIFYFVFTIKSVSDPSIMGTILFSIILIGVYFQYWGFYLN